MLVRKHRGRSESRRQTFELLQSDLEVFTEMLSGAFSVSQLDILLFFHFIYCHISLSLCLVVLHLFPDPSFFSFLFFSFLSYSFSAFCDQTLCYITFYCTSNLEPAEHVVHIFYCDNVNSVLYCAYLIQFRIPSPPPRFPLFSSLLLLFCINLLNFRCGCEASAACRKEPDHTSH